MLGPGDRSVLNRLASLARLAAASACIAVLVAATQARPAGEAADPNDIFAKHAAAIGYSLADGRMKPYIVEMTTTTEKKGGDTRTSTTVRKQAGAYFASATAFKGRNSSDGFDGRGFWWADENGNVINAIGLARKYDVTWAVINAEAFGPALPSELRTPTATDYVVRVTPDSGVPADVYFNKTTYYIDRVVVDPNLEKEEETYADYERHGQVAFAGTRTSGESTTKVTRFAWDAQLMAADFDRPSQRSYASFPDSGSSVVPFDDKRSEISFEATVNGVKGTFILDTGTDGIYFSPSFAQRAQLPRLNTSAVSGIGGTVSTSVTQVDRFRVGDVELQHFYATISSHEFEGWDGFAGFDFLAQVVCDINYDSHKLTITNPAVYKDDGKRVAIVIALDDHTPQIYATVNEKVKTYMDLDTGDSSSITFTRVFVDSNPGIVARGAEARFVGAGGLEEGYIGTIDQFQVGPYQFFGIEADVIAGFKGFAAERLTQGLIGYQVLRRFNLTFDYRGGKLYLDLSKYGHQTKF